MMERWRQILAQWGPREDANSEFYPDKVEPERPVLLNQMGSIAAAFVGARLLRAIVARRGSVLRPSAVEKLERLAARGLSKEVVHHCEAEAERILEWLGHAPPVDSAGKMNTGSAELDMMMAADLESRLSVATFALEQEYDLELEYFDEESRTWPRIRAELLGIEQADVADFDTSLEIRDRFGEATVPLKQVRWLMPVPARSGDELEPPKGGDVLQFPGSDNES